MRRFLVLAFLLVAVLVALGMTSGVALAEAAPFGPGDVLFPIQHYAEQQAFFRSGQDQKAGWFLEVAERRAADAGTLLGTEDQQLALAYFSDSLTQIAIALSEASPDTIDALHSRLTAMLTEADAFFAGVTPGSESEREQIVALRAKISTFQELVSDSNVTADDLTRIVSFDSSASKLDVLAGASLAPAENSNLPDPLAVPFPEGSPGDEHEFFPLVGAHGSVDCEACHSDGNYQGTPSACESCHANDIPQDHYQGDCALCHAATTWDDVIFDHAAAMATDCESCHLDDRPADHYPGQCANCHATDNWSNVHFNHAGFTDCQSCHSVPVDHYPGQCSSCHMTDNWSNVHFNHAGFSDCQGCHAPPAGHYSGQCSQCHTTNNWDFTHPDNGDCQACHAPPNGHFSGQCSLCHTTDNWSNVHFNHAGFSDCQGCHAPPAGHYSDQCSKCHSTNNWSFNHAGNSDCRSCHTPPSGHYGGQCSQCHSTNNWSFDHSDNSDCQACHSLPGDHEGGSGQCSDCHSTGTWDGAEGDEGGDGSDDGGDDDGGDDDDDDDDDD